MQTIKLGIIDDSIFCRNLTKLQLSNIDSTRFDFVLEAESIADMQEKANEANQPAVILLDIMMPGIDGITGIPLIKEKFPNAYIIMLSDISDQSIVRKSILGGANAFIKKGTSNTDMIRIITDVMSEKIYACPQLTKLLFFGLQKPPKDRRRLSERELLIVHRLLDGQSYDRVANLIKISKEKLQELIQLILVKLKLVNSEVAPGSLSS